MSALNYLLQLFLLLIFFGCQSYENKNIVPTARKVAPNISLTNNVSKEIPKLSDYSFFKGKLSDLTPSEDVYMYK